MVSAWMGNGSMDAPVGEGGDELGRTPRALRRSVVVSMSSGDTYGGSPDPARRRRGSARAGRPRWRSMTSGASGSTWAEPGHHLATGGDEELLEVPADVAGVALGVGDWRRARS